MNARNWEAVKLLNSAAATTNGVGAATDMATYATTGKREIKAVAFLSNLTTTATVTVSVTECATSGGTYSAPANGSPSVVLTANGMGEFNFRNDLRYLKGNIVVNATGVFNLSLAVIALKRFADS